MRNSAWVIVSSWTLLGLGCSARELGSSFDDALEHGGSDGADAGDADEQEQDEGDADESGEGELEPCASPRICNNGDAVEVLARYFFALSHAGVPQTCAEQRELAWAITGWSDHRIACLDDLGCSDHTAELACAAACRREFATCMDASACDPACPDSYTDCEAACGDSCSAKERWACTLAVPYEHAGELGCEGMVQGALGRAELADSLAGCLVEQRGCGSTVAALHCEAYANEALAACDESNACRDPAGCWTHADELQAACLATAG